MELCGTPGGLEGGSTESGDGQNLKMLVEGLPDGTLRHTWRTRGMSKYELPTGDA